jgi:hypothetical protein
MVKTKTEAQCKNFYFNYKRKLDLENIIAEHNAAKVPALIASRYCFVNYEYICTPGKLEKYAWCAYTLRVTSQASYSPEYITPTQKKSWL